MEESASAPSNAVRNPIGKIYPEAKAVKLFVNDRQAEDGKPLFTKPNGVLLTSAQRNVLERSFFAIPQPDYGFACFIPHHFFRYYDEKGKQIGQLAVCFCCQGVQSSSIGVFGISAKDELSADYRKLRALVRELGEPVKVNC